MVQSLRTEYGMLYLVPQIIPPLVSLIRNIRALGIQVVKEVSTTFGDPPKGIIHLHHHRLSTLLQRSLPQMHTYIHTYIPCKFTALEVDCLNYFHFFRFLSLSQIGAALTPNLCSSVLYCHR